MSSATTDTSNEQLVEEAVAGITPGRVLWGRCQEIEGAPAFWPWIQALRVYVRATPDAWLRGELGDDAAELARLVPAIRTRCPDVAAPREETLDPETARFRLFDAMTMFLQSFMIRAEEGRLGELEPVVAMAAEGGVMLPIWRAALAILHAALGRSDAAHEVLTDLGKLGFRDLPRDGNLLGTYANLAQVCALLDAPRFAEPLVPLLAPYVDTVIVPAFTAGCLGSAARYAGLLANTLGQLDDAVVYFETALATNERIGALPQLAHTQHELARSLRARGARRDRDRAVGLEAQAAAIAGRLGLVALQQRLAADYAAPRPAVAVTPSPPPGPTHRAARLRHEGDVWTIACGNELTLLKDTKGVAYLLELLRHPGHEFHALDLGGAEDVRASDAGELLDADARRAYKARLGELRDELEEAEEFHDIGRAARLREEMEVLADELTRASGLGGRTRRAGSNAERARVNVSRAVRKVVRTIKAECPVLGRHLDRSVQTGLFCAYEPDPTFPVDWEL